MDRAIRDMEMGRPTKRQSSPEKTKVYPDQWCFRNDFDFDGNMRPLFVVEYKAAHKVKSSILRHFLTPEKAASLMKDTIQALRRNKDYFETNKEYSVKLDDPIGARHDVAKIITQVFHYMIDYGLQFSYATTGDAFVFFYLDPEQPSELYYHLEEPMQNKDLKHSAVALVTSFVLMSIQGLYMSQNAKRNILKTHPKWPTPYADMLPTKATPEPDTAAASASISTTLVTFLGKQAVETCEDPTKKTGLRRPDEVDDPEGGGVAGPGPGRLTATATTTATTTATATATNAPREKATQESTEGKSNSAMNTQTQAGALPKWAAARETAPKLEYCTQACLLGLKSGGKKDRLCPNVALHKKCDNESVDDGDSDERHPISLEEFKALLTQQLGKDLDHDCQSLERFGMFGAIGALFKLALSAYGYCFVGKGVQRVHRKRLEKEAMIYGALQACQGRLIPVNLGIIMLEEEFWTECGAHITHMMLMSFAGLSLSWLKVKGKMSAAQSEKKTRTEMLAAAKYHDEKRRTLSELSQYGLDQGDDNDKNAVWNEELQRVFVIDFDRATIQPKTCLTVGIAERAPAGKKLKHTL